MTFDASDAEQVHERKKQVRSLKDRRVNGLKKLAADEDGRAWIWQFLEQASPFVSPFDATSDSKTAFNCGAKVMTVQITEQMLSHCPAEYYLMIEEAKKPIDSDKENKDE